MARRRSDPLGEVEFFGNGEVDWARFRVYRPEGGLAWNESLYARKIGERLITFGRTYGPEGHGEGSISVPASRGERTFRIDVLRRIVDNGLPSRLSGGRFQDKTATTVDYRTTCGELRTVRLSVLRAIVEDAEALP